MPFPTVTVRSATLINLTLVPPYAATTVLAPLLCVCKRGTLGRTYKCNTKWVRAGVNPLNLVAVCALKIILDVRDELCQQ